MPTSSDREYYDSFRARLILIRKACKHQDGRSWSQADMATALGIPLVNYKSYERRSKFPQPLIERLALVSHRDVDFIVTGRSTARMLRGRAA